MSSRTRKTPSSTSKSTGFIPTLLAVLIFGSISSISWFYLHVQQHSTIDLNRAFSYHCPSPSAPPSPLSSTSIGAYRVLTGYHSADYILCLLTNAFHFLLTEPERVINVPLILALPLPWLGVILDAYTLFPTSRVAAIGFPALLGCFVQTYGAGIALPVYWFISLTSRIRDLSSSSSSSSLTSRKRAPAPVRPNDSAIFAACLAIALGALIPTGVMVYYPTFDTILIWQFFPLYVAFIQVLLAPSSPPSGGPYTHVTPDPTPGLIWAMLLGTFGVLTLAPLPAHIEFIRSVVPSTFDGANWRESIPEIRAKLSGAFVPYLHAYAYDTLEDLAVWAPRNETKRFIQWDVIFIALSSWCAGAWKLLTPRSASSSSSEAEGAGVLGTTMKGLALFVASVLGSMVLGPGVMMGGVYVLAEMRDQKARERAETEREGVEETGKSAGKSKAGRSPKKGKSRAK